MPVAVEWVHRGPEPGASSKPEEDSTLKGVLAKAECQMLSEVRKALTEALGKQSARWMRTAFS